jgi:hypothetical protein
MASLWLDVLAWVCIAGALACAAWIAWDIFARGYRQEMAIMDAVWPITALYLGPVAVWAYRRWGRLVSPRYQREHGVRADYGEPVSVAIGVSHCGAGCSLGDLVGEWVIFAFGAELAGLALYPEMIADFALALALGVVFQYFAIAPARGLGPKEGVIEALKADFLSLTAFEVGLFGWMAIFQLAIFDRGLHPDSPAYWLLMQVGMVLGFATAYPVNVWLLRRGIKEGM